MWIRDSRATGWRRPVARYFVVVALAFAAAGAIAEEPSRLSLRLSDELTLGAAVPRAAAIPTGVSPTLGARDYRIGTDDLLEVQVFGVDQLTRTVRVNSRGMISLPLIGSLEVGGMNAQQAEALIVAKLAESYLQDPQVSLFIKEYTSQRVTIEGAVNRPGVYPLRGPTTLLQSLAVAGGQGGLSDMSEVMLFRADASGNKETLVYDVDRIRAGELADPVVVNDDLIVVKRSKGRIILKDSILKDILDTVNPFRWGNP
jgi:polysaccharide export outer membrane protein